MNQRLPSPTALSTSSRLAATVAGLAVAGFGLMSAAAHAQTVIPTLAMSVGGLDSNHFIVGHPASPSWKRPRANAQHPAVQLQARTSPDTIDSNAFRVQPPASVLWTVRPPVVLLARVPGQV